MKTEPAAREETGHDVELIGILGVYTDPGHVIAYQDGEVRQEFMVVFADLERRDRPYLG